MSNVLAALASKIEQSQAPAIDTPDSSISFFEWLHTYAMVKVGNKFVKYSTKGRQPLFVVILIIDYVLGNDISYAPAEQRQRILGTTEYGKIIPDAQIDVCGGAQFGKTILALLLKTYLGTVQFRGMMYCLPDDDLVQGIIDAKERPEVIDQIAYVGEMLQIGKTLTASGKAANRKGAMLYTNGNTSSISMMRGLGKFPTTFSCDVVAVDERDDVREEFADYLPGRMTTSDLRLMLNIGTQRYHGAGQNRLFEEGSQHVGAVICPKCGRRHCLEEDWPGVVRMSVTGQPAPMDPVLNEAGVFTIHGDTVAKYKPEYTYYFGCVACGTPLPREEVLYEARKPEQIFNRHWSVRVSQMCCSALNVSMFVADWCKKRKKDNRAAFACDRLAIPKSSNQKITPKILDRAATVDPYSMSMQVNDKLHRFGGLDMGDQCWLMVRELDGRFKRLQWAEAIADSDTVQRSVQLFDALKLDCLFIDAGPLRDTTRAIVLALNGCNLVDVTVIKDWEKKRISFPGGVTWDGEYGRWLGLKSAAVEFTGKPGSGIKQQARLTPDNNHIYPVISVNRDEAIQGVIDELLTAEDGFAVIDEETDTLRTIPEFLLPKSGQDEPGIVETVREHLLCGSRKILDNDGKEEHFIDKVANHLLLAATYARLAEMFSGVLSKRTPFACSQIRRNAPGERQHPRVF
ncbi:MAG: hypothetical protein EOM20_06810 [Spartobacteria bacterium]|nr:hypothetical protein [Spartobacteria bacterium]